MTYKIKDMRGYRKKYGFTQEELAEVLSVTKQRISQIETGLVPQVPDIMYRFADLQGVRVSQVIDE